MSQTGRKQIQHATLGAHLIVGHLKKKKVGGGSKSEVFSGGVGLTA